MSTFYLLPPRAVLDDHLADSLHAFLPGLDLDVATRAHLGELLHRGLAGRDVYLVHRDELPAGEPAERALVEGWGAAPGDEVVEVRPGPRPGVFVSRRWRIGPAGLSAQAA
jgi:hypothetical protein